MQIIKTFIQQGHPKQKEEIEDVILKIHESTLTTAKNIRRIIGDTTDLQVGVVICNIKVYTAHWG